MRSRQGAVALTLPSAEDFGPSDLPGARPEWPQRADLAPRGRANHEKPRCYRLIDPAATRSGAPCRRTGRFFLAICLGGRRGSNPQPSQPQCNALPLSYAHRTQRRGRQETLRGAPCQSRTVTPRACPRGCPCMPRALRRRQGPSSHSMQGGGRTAPGLDISGPFRSYSCGCKGLSDSFKTRRPCPERVTAPSGKPLTIVWFDRDPERGPAIPDPRPWHWAPLAVSLAGSTSTLTRAGTARAGEADDLQAMIDRARNGVADLERLDDKGATRDEAAVLRSWLDEAWRLRSEHKYDDVRIVLDRCDAQAEMIRQKIQASKLLAQAAEREERVARLRAENDKTRKAHRAGPPAKGGTRGKDPVTSMRGQTAAPTAWCRTGAKTRAGAADRLRGRVRDPAQTARAGRARAAAQGSQGRRGGQAQRRPGQRGRPAAGPLARAVARERSERGAPLGAAGPDQAQADGGGRRPGTGAQTHRRGRRRGQAAGR